MPGHAYRFRLIGQRIQDICLLFRHQSRGAEDLFGEAAYHWPDQRGIGFAKGILIPTVGLFAGALQALNEHSRALQQAETAAEAAELAFAIVQNELETTYKAADQACRSAADAEHFAATANERAQGALATCGEVHRGLAVLGNPPI
jgi:hypothetical protein